MTARREPGVTRRKSSSSNLSLQASGANPASALAHEIPRAPVELSPA